MLVATTNDGAYRTAFDLAAAGAQVIVADLRPSPAAGLLAEAARLGISVRAGTRIADLRGTRSVKAAKLAGPGGDADIDCDLVCVSGGWSPTVHLTSHLGVKPVYREDIDGFVPGALPGGQFSAGAVLGDYTIAHAIETGHRAGLEAAAFCGATKPVARLEFPEAAIVAGDDPLSASLRSAPLPHAVGERKGAKFAASASSPPSIGGEVARPELVEGANRSGGRSAFKSRGKAFVDFQMDVTTADIALAHREGYELVEHLKRYTTLGMGTDQGKTSNFPALAAMASLRQTTVPETGTTTFRPPFTPVAVGALAGRAVGHHFRPFRRTPMHDWHLANDAEMLEVGLWMRPYFYGLPAAT